MARIAIYKGAPSVSIQQDIRPVLSLR